ncbi:unnamed protein product [Adineta ricciae]|uniref:Uncharacterized protein n=1 Tax=Adineta ricciae TaxID=249248 RepID=A0A814LY39_ADIRI|nr:unnamed protein product [Adineta ricciae]
MLFQQEFYLLWSSLELFMALTHLFVFLGFRNPKLGFLRRQQNYFLLDAFTHAVNALLHSPKTFGGVLHVIWLFAFIVHLYYYRNLTVNPPPRRQQTSDQSVDDNSHKISRIFHWSCLEFQADRFSIMQSGKEMLETIIDVVAHTAGFYLAFHLINSFVYKLVALLLMLALLYRQMLSLKYFFTEMKMMPPHLQRLFSSFSSNPVAN